MTFHPARRYHEEINGRSVVIEVLRVSQDRWRAQIARRPGATTALMPFYGGTPDDAVRLLSEWLARVTPGAGRTVHPTRSAR
jgi:hypothetical protein